MTPTPSQFSSPCGVADKDADLDAKVIGLLRSNHLEVNNTMEILLRYTIKSTIDAYESKLQTSEQAISELCTRLNILEQYQGEFALDLMEPKAKATGTSAA